MDGIRVQTTGYGEGTDVTSREIAEPNTILRGTVGSTVHGLHLEGSDDRDEMGVCLEPREHVVGFGKFQQWVHRDQPEGVRSQPGDLDLTVYSLRKWAWLALRGNPTVLLLLFVPPEECQVRTKHGKALQYLAPAFASKRAGKAFLGYLMQQSKRMAGELGQKGVNRPELVRRYGFDTKYAMHALRLGYQGVEYMKTGRITLPVPEPHRSFLRAVRQGDVTMTAIQSGLCGLEHEIEDLLQTSPLPDEPDVATVERFVMDAYEQQWERVRNGDWSPAITLTHKAYAD